MKQSAFIFLAYSIISTQVDAVNRKQNRLPAAIRASKPAPAPVTTPVRRAGPRSRVAKPIRRPTASPVIIPQPHTPRPTLAPVVAPPTPQSVAPVAPPTLTPTIRPPPILPPTLAPSTIQATIPCNITVGVYYYPWYGSNFHNHQGYLRSQLNPPQQPALGEYDDTNPAVIAQHLAWSRQANIKLWVTSWWGSGTIEDNTTLNVILPHPDLAIGSNKIALQYETTGRIHINGNYTTENVAGDITWMCQNYFNNQNYYTINGRPVIVIYLARALYDKGILQEVTQLMRTTAQSVCGLNPYLIGDLVWGNAPASSTVYPPFSWLDAVTNFDVYGNLNSELYAGQAAVDNFYQTASAWRQSALAGGARYVPSAITGFNDRGVRLDKNHTALSRQLDATSDEGTFFIAELLQARNLVDPGADNLLLINSFNEWHEDTQLEPCVGLLASLPLSLTQGLPYEGYGDLYLNILRLSTYSSNPACVANSNIFVRASISTPHPATAIQTTASNAPSVTPGTTSATLTNSSTLLVTKRNNLPPSPCDITVGVYYYPWYGNNFHNHQGYLRSQLIPQHQPALGEYDSTNTTVIAQHLAWSRQANIKLWVTSWWGPGRSEDRTIREVILPHPDLAIGSNKIALQYETTGRIHINGNYTTQNVPGDIRWMCQNYFNNSNYYTMNGRPVIVIYLSRILYDKGILQEVIQLIRTTAQRVCGLNPYLIGDQVWGKAPAISAAYPPFSWLDAVTNFDVYGNMNSNQYAGQVAVDKYYNQSSDWRQVAGNLGVGYVPSVSAGFNDRGVRLNENHKAMSRRLNGSNDPGMLFASALERARYLVDPGARNSRPYQA